MKRLTNIMMLAMALGLVVSSCKPGKDSTPVPLAAAPRITITQSSTGDVKGGIVYTDSTITFSFEAVAAAGLREITINSVREISNFNGIGPVVVRLMTQRSGFKTATRHDTTLSFKTPHQGILIMELNVLDNEGRTALAEYRLDGRTNGPGPGGSMTVVFSNINVGGTPQTGKVVSINPFAGQVQLNFNYTVSSGHNLREVKYDLLRNGSITNISTLTSGFSQATQHTATINHTVPASEPAGSYKLIISGTDVTNRRVSDTITVRKPTAVFRTSALLVAVSSNAYSNEAGLPADISAAITAGTTGSYFNAQTLTAQPRLNNVDVRAQIAFKFNASASPDTVPVLVSPTNTSIEDYLTYSTQSSVIKASNLNFASASAEDISLAVLPPPSTTDGRITQPGTFIFQRADGLKGLINVTEAKRYRKGTSPLDSKAYMRFQVKTVELVY